ncbi:hypothetical protein HanIR_Chr13g0667851 [Helianthus annuus]|nr:hypothetical protein HanIR_Chr13g0667851 [Helianthus annuus]
MNKSLCQRLFLSRRPTFPFGFSFFFPVHPQHLHHHHHLTLVLGFPARTPHRRHLVRLSVIVTLGFEKQTGQKHFALLGSNHNNRLESSSDRIASNFGWVGYHNRKVDAWVG